MVEHLSAHSTCCLKYAPYFLMATANLHCEGPPPLENCSESGSKDIWAVVVKQHRIQLADARMTTHTLTRPSSFLPHVCCVVS